MSLNISNTIKSFKKFFSLQFSNIGLEKRIEKIILNAKNQDDSIKRISDVHLSLDYELEKLDRVCTKGCSTCCHQVVNVFKDEAEIIKNYITNHFTLEQRKITTAIAEEYIKKVNKSFKGKKFTALDFSYKNYKENCFKGIQCPFLHDNLCAIYQVRPIECRAFLSIKEPEACQAKQGEYSNPNPNWIATKIRIKTCECYANFICKNDITQFTPLIFEIDAMFNINRLTTPRTKK